MRRKCRAFAAQPSLDCDGAEVSGRRVRRRYDNALAGIFIPGRDRCTAEPAGHGDGAAISTERSANHHVGRDRGQCRRATLAHTLTADEAVTWSIVGGADAAKFEISGVDVALAGDGMKDFEAPDDADTTTPTWWTCAPPIIGFETADQTITVTVSDVAEVLPGFAGSAMVAGRRRCSSMRDGTARAGHMSTASWSICEVAHGNLLRLIQVPAGTNNGSSWANAFTTLTAAFAPAGGGRHALRRARSCGEPAARSHLDFQRHGCQSDQGDLRRPRRHGAAGRRRPARHGKVATTTQHRSSTSPALRITTGSSSTAARGVTSANIIVLDTDGIGYGSTIARCGSVIATGSAGSILGRASPADGTCVELNNTTLSFGTTGHTMCVCGRAAMAQHAIGIAAGLDPDRPCSLVQRHGNGDMSSASASTCRRQARQDALFGDGDGNQSFRSRFLDCKLNASVTKSAVPAGAWRDRDRFHSFRRDRRQLHGLSPSHGRPADRGDDHRPDRRRVGRHHADRWKVDDDGELHLFAAVRMPADRDLERHHRLGGHRDGRGHLGRRRGAER